MSSGGFVTSLVLAACLAGTSSFSEGSDWQRIDGTPKAQKEFHSSYINVPDTTSFRTGERLRFNLNGTAKQVIVRLLPSDGSYDSPTGVIDKKLPVVKTQDGNYVEVVLTEDRPNVKQLSVHGGPRPFDMWALGGDNGDPILTSVQRASPVRPPVAAKPAVAPGPAASDTRAK
jgi:hypothetical protein